MDWLLLAYSLPKEPSRYRVSIWRRLRKLGAVYLTFTSGYGVVAKNRLVCMLHSSAFDVASGEVLTGPAPDPLKTYETLLDDGQVFIPLPN